MAKIPSMVDVLSRAKKLQKKLSEGSMLREDVQELLDCVVDIATNLSVVEVAVNDIDRRTERHRVAESGFESIGLTLAHPDKYSTRPR